MKLDRALGALQNAVHESATALAIRVYLAVAANEGSSVSEVARITRLPLSTASRVLLDLGVQNRDKGKGFGLVEVKPDPHDLRVKRYYLTQDGLRAFNAILEKLK